MKISVVTVVWNDCDHIEETLKSVLEQTGEGFELEYVVIDGASSDGTLRILERYEDRLGCLVSEKDSGIYNAMNKGIARCTGEIIGMINSGDRYLPGALALVADSFGKLPDISGRIFWGDVLYERRGLVRGFRRKNLLMGAFAPHPSMFVPRCVYEKIGAYDEKFRLMGDYEFMYRAVNVAGIQPLYVPVPVAFYREDGLSDRNVLRCLKEELQVKIRWGQDPLWAKLIFWLKVVKNYPRIAANRRLENA